MTTILFFLIGAILLILSTPTVHLQLLDPIANAYLWQRSSVIAVLLGGYGIAFMSLALWSRWLAARGESFFAQLFGYGRDVSVLIRDNLRRAIAHPLAPRRAAGWLLVIICLGSALRAFFLAQPIRYDEAYTFLNFVNKDFFHLFAYPYPNNHVLHTILVKLSTLLWGPHPAAIRLPAFFAGIAAIPLVYCLARALVGEKSGTFATVTVAVVPYLVLYSTIARGYSLLVLLTMLLVLTAARAAKAPSIAASIVLSVIASLGMLTIPSMAFPIAGVFLWLAFVYFLNGNGFKQVFAKFALPSAIMTTGLTAVLYTPVIVAANGIEPLIANDYVDAQPFGEFLAQLGPHVAGTLADFARDIPAPVLLASLALMTVGVYAAAKRRNWPMVLLLPTVLAGSIALLFLKRAIPYPRTWIFLIPIMLLLAETGWVYCVEFLSRGMRRSLTRGVAVAGACYAVLLISSNAIVKYPDTGTFPEAALVAGYLKPLMRYGDKVHVAIPADYPVYFYLWYNNLGHIRAAGASNNPRAKFFVVKKSRYSIGDIAEEPVLKLVEVADAAVYQNYPTGQDR